jgi:hypothetical protein
VLIRDLIDEPPTAKLADRMAKRAYGKPRRRCTFVFNVPPAIKCRARPEKTLKKHELARKDDLHCDPDQPRAVDPVVLEVLERLVYLLEGIVSHFGPNGYSDGFQQ